MEIDIFRIQFLQRLSQIAKELLLAVAQDVYAELMKKEDIDMLCMAGRKRLDASQQEIVSIRNTDQLLMI